MWAASEALVKRLCVSVLVLWGLMFAVETRGQSGIFKGAQLLAKAGRGRSAVEIFTELARAPATRAGYLTQLRQMDPGLAAQVGRELALFSPQDLDGWLQQNQGMTPRILSEQELFPHGVPAPPPREPDWGLRADRIARRAMTEALPELDVVVTGRGSSLDPGGVPERDLATAQEAMIEVLRDAVAQVLQQEMRRAKGWTDASLTALADAMHTALRDQTRLVAALMKRLEAAASTPRAEGPDRLVVYQPDTDTLMVQPIGWGPVGIDAFSLRNVRKKLATIGAAVAGYAVAQAEEWLGDDSGSDLETTVAPSVGTP